MFLNVLFIYKIWKGFKPKLTAKRRGFWGGFSLFHKLEDCFIIKLRIPTRKKPYIGDFLDIDCNKNAFTSLANEFENSEKSLQNYHRKSVDPKSAEPILKYQFFVSSV